MNELLEFHLIGETDYRRLLNPAYLVGVGLLEAGRI